MVNVPPPSAMLRMVAFAVAAGLAMAGVQPIVAASTGEVDMRWAFSLSAPALLAAMLIFGALVEFTLIPWTMWTLLVAGGVLWTGALVLVRSNSH